MAISPSTGCSAHKWPSSSHAALASPVILGPRLRDCCPATGNAPGRGRVSTDPQSAIRQDLPCPETVPCWRWACRKDSSRAAKLAQWRPDHPWGGVCIAPHRQAQRPQEQACMAFSGSLPQVISQVGPNGSCTPGTSLTGPGPAVVSMEVPGRCHGPLGAQSAPTPQSL